jgi:hypothetical protein
MLLLALVTVVTASEPASGQHAALTYMRGDPAAARAEIAAVLKASPGDVQALVIAACIEVETAGPEAAEPYVARLERLPTRPPETAVLRQLLSRRRRAPSEPIEDAVARAWSAAGAPDLSERHLFPSFDPWPGAIIPPLPQAVLDRLTPAERLLFTGDDHQKQAANAMLAGVAAEQNLLVVNLEILSAVAPGEPLPKDLQADAQHIAASVGPIVAKSDPANGYLAVAALLSTGTSPDPLSAADLALLDDAAARPRFEVPRRELLEQLKVMAHRFDPAYGTMRAVRAALGTSVPIFRLWKRAEATPDDAMRRRAGALLSAIAGRLACSGTLLERMLGVALAEKGAKLANNDAVPDSTRADAARFREWYRAATARSQKAGTWPFAEPWRDWEGDHEIEHFEAYGDSLPKLTAPTLVCQQAPAHRSRTEPGAIAVREFRERTGIAFAPCSDTACLRESERTCRPSHFYGAHRTIEGATMFKDLFIVPEANCSVHPTSRQCRRRKSGGLSGTVQACYAASATAGLSFSVRYSAGVLQPRA